jgi:hypothetical protein
VHIVAHAIRIEIVSVADLHPDPQWLGWAVWDQVRTKTMDSAVG